VFSSSLGARGLPTKKSETICKLPWNYWFLRRTLKWACCCDCPEQSIGIYSLGSSLKCVGLEYKPWYRDMGREFKDLAPSSHSCNFFSSLYTIYILHSLHVSLFCFPASHYLPETFFCFSHLIWVLPWNFFPSDLFFPPLLPTRPEFHGEN